MSEQLFIAAVMQVLFDSINYNYKCIDKKCDRPYLIKIRYILIKK